MPRRRTPKGCAECGVRDDVPEEILSELAHVGGINGLCTRIPPTEDLEVISRRHQALSDPIRLRILALLACQPLCVCVLKQCIRIADSKLSYHLNILKMAGLIEGRSVKNWIIYNLTDDGKSYAGDLSR